MQVASVTGDFKEGKVNLNSRPLDPKAAVAPREMAGLNTETIQNDLKQGNLPDAKLIGETLFIRYNLHLQMVGVILAIATVGVIVLSRREDKSASSET